MLAARPSDARADQGLATGADINKGIVEIFVLTLDSNGQLGKDSATGTGFIVNDKGIVITNRHVIKSALVPVPGQVTRIFVNPDGQLMNIVEDTFMHSNAEVVWSSESLDLAILQTNGLHNVAPVKLTTAIPTPGDAVLAIGYPGAAERNDFKGGDVKSIATVTSGVFSRKMLSSWDEGSRPLEMIQHSAAISWGNSGGPLLDACRRVIGVNTQLSLKGKSYSRDAAGNLTEGIAQAEGIYFASSSNELITILKQRDVPIASLETNPCGTPPVASEHPNPAPQPNNQPSTPVTQVTQVNPPTAAGGNWMDKLTANKTALLAGGGVLIALALGLVMLTQRRKPTYVDVGPAPANDGNLSTKTRAIRGPTVAVGTGGTAGIPVVEFVNESGEVKLRMLPNDFLRGPVIVGREPPVERFTLTDNSVSRQHFGIEFADGKLYVNDLNSLNGTFIDSQRLDPSARAEVKAGQTIMVGSLKLLVRFT